ncbi:MAG: hypothetical protein GKR89_05200 [Candidatus Latescibacteria bacterium]|nr:hypothetical protein [Candidatus Latescibacterota bacterium]
MDDTNDRKYSDAEISLIIKRAAELQQARDSSPGTAGLELGELKQIAGEMGLDSEHIATAAEELEWAEPPSEQKGWLSKLFTTAPQGRDYQRTIANGSFTPVRAEALVEAINTTLPVARGQVQQTDRLVKLSTADKLISLKLLVYANAPVGHPIRIRLSAKWRRVAFLFRLPFLLSIPLVLNLDPVTFDESTRMALTAIIPALVWLLTGMGYSAWSNKQWERINLLVKRIEAILTNDDPSQDH